MMSNAHRCWSRRISVTQMSNDTMDYSWCNSLSNLDNRDFFLVKSGLWSGVKNCWKKERISASLLHALQVLVQSGNIGTKQGIKSTLERR